MHPEPKLWGLESCFAPFLPSAAAVSFSPSKPADARPHSPVPVGFQEQADDCCLITSPRSSATGNIRTFQNSAEQPTFVQELVVQIKVIIHLLFLTVKLVKVVHDCAE